MMMMMANFGKPLMPGSFIEPHGLAQHQIIEGQPFYSLSYSSTSSHPVINYWPGSYHLDDGVLSSHGPNHLVQGEVDNSHVENDNHNLLKLELPDLNLDPSL
ncbi:hypothetical protein BVRB_008660 [Beta vulgaris subsp. vulgaris]|uniref:Uncharacterized protein n=1 Tax=Beta vulgaris subsp. vulgaris TaxID=3555 RepID=A0A0J8B688_BETVV|nr:hypothetical protein BVRB_008660 [Beta vulgaris subsp. vulgaris]